MKALKIILSFLMFFTFNAPAYSQVIEGKTAPGLDAKKNYIYQGNAEVKITGINQYNDGASSRPVDCTGGTGSVTMARSSTAPIEDKWSWIVTKDAVNRQGHGVSIDFTAPKVKAMTLAARYLVNSGTFTAGTTGSSATDSDLIFYIYDVTNSRLIEPSTFRLYSNQTGWDEPYSGEFQTSSDSTSYRLCMHVATTSASAWSLKLDEISAAISKRIFGPPTTGEQSYTPTIGGLGTGSASINYATHQRFGNLVRLVGRAGLSNVTGSSVITWSLPSGMSIDFSKVSSGTAQFQGAGSYINGAGNSTNSGITAHASNGTSNTISFTRLSSTANTDLSATDIGAGTTGAIFFEIFLPIQGWDITSQQSDGYDGRAVSAKYYGAASTSMASGTTYFLGFGTKVYDNHAAFTTSASHVTTTNTGSKYIVPVSGKYRVTVKTHISSATPGWAGTSSEYIQIAAYVNGSAPSGSEISVKYPTGDEPFTYGGGTVLLDVNSGDRIEIAYTQASGAAQTLLTNTQSWVEFERIGGTSTMSATTSIEERWTGSTTAISSGATTILVFPTKSRSTHGSYNPSTGIFTAQTAGWYSVKAHVGGTWGAAANNFIGLHLYKNNSLYSYMGRLYTSNNSSTTGVWGSDDVYLNAQETCDVRFANALSQTFTADGSNSVSWISITRTGN